MKILITGGAGFIGSNFLHYMINNYPNYRYVCLDALTYAGNIKTLDNIINNSNFKFIKGDISNCKLIFDLFEKEKFDIVINFAAESHVDRSIKKPDIFLKTNILGVGVLLDACNNYGIKRFHQVSTDEVYGNLPLNRSDLKFTEESILQASNPYSASKASADLLVRAYHHTFGLPITVSRCSNNYGPYHFPEKLIPLIITRALSNQELPIYGDGLNIRDWLHVYDHCTAIDSIIHKGIAGEIYNIGSNNEKSNLEVVKTILQILEKPESLITFVNDRAGHDKRYAIDASKIQRELNWHHAYDFNIGIERTINWYLENREWWQPLKNSSMQYCKK